MDRITGLYSYYDYDEDGNKVRMFVYTYEDSKGNINYGFTDDLDEARGLTTDLLKNRKCKTKEDANKLAKEKDIFNFNCKDKNDVFLHIKKANKNVKLNSDDFDKAKDQYDKEAKGSIFSRLLNRGKNLKSTILNLPKKAWYRFKDLPKAKKIKYSSAFVAIAVAFGIGAFFINKSKSPTNDGPKVGITDEIGGIDKDIDEAINQKEEEKTAETPEEPVVTAEQSSTGYYTYDTSWTQPTNSGSNVTTTPGTVNESLGGFQDPNASIDGSTNNPTPPTDSETPDNPYGNVSEGEEDNNYQEGEKPDNDYSEEIDVPAGGEDQPTNQEDIILDDNYLGNEGSVDFEVGVGDDYELDYANPNDPLPDSNNTANGDYVTSDEELQQNNNGQQSSEITGEENTQEVPVYQDENITTTNTTATTTPTDLEIAASKAVEAMANGEAGNIVVNTDGSISFEDTNTMEANGMTK